MLKLAAKEERALEDYVSRLRGELGDQIVELRLFGSKARGEGRAESDIDVLVIVEEADTAIENLVVDIAFDVNLEHGVLIAPVVFSRRARENPLWPISDLCRAAERDGIPL